MIQTRIKTKMMKKNYESFKGVFRKALGKRHVELAFAAERGLGQTPVQLTAQLNRHLKANIVSFSVLLLTRHTVKVVGGRPLTLIVEPTKYFAEVMAYFIVGCTLATILGVLEDGFDSDMLLMLIPLPIMSFAYFVMFIRTSNFLVNRSIVFLEDFFDGPDGSI